MEYQTEVEIELDVEEEKLQRSRTRFKRQRIHLNHSNIEQPQRRRRWLSGETVSKFKLQRTWRRKARHMERTCASSVASNGSTR